MTSYILGIIASLLTLVVVVELLRRRHLRERHAIWWFVAAVLGLVVSVFPAILVSLAQLLGVEVPTNLVFFTSIAILFFVCLQHSSEVTRLENNVRTLAESAAIHELRLRQLEDQANSVDVSTSEASDT